MQGLARKSFVSRSVISSSDGLDFKEESTAAPDNEDIHPDLKKLDGRSLYEQLKERQDEAEAERQARFKLNFAPPKALDDEDIAHYEQLEEQQREVEVRTKRQEELDRAAYGAPAAAAGAAGLGLPAAEPRDAFEAPDAGALAQLAPVVAVRRRVRASAEHGGAEAAGGADKRARTGEPHAHRSKHARGRKADEHEGGEGAPATRMRGGSEQAPAVPPGGAALPGLAAYGSDSDEDEE